MVIRKYGPEQVVQIRREYRVFTKNNVYFEGAEHHRSTPMKEKKSSSKESS